MSVKFEPGSVWTALATPFSADLKVDVPCLAKFVEFQVSQGVSGVLPCGTTGESPTLDWQEHDAVIDDVIKAVDGRVGVLAGTGSNNTLEAIRGSEHARSAGADAVLLVDCYYNGPSSLELRTEYYERILNEVSTIPVVPYIIPGRSGCALSAVDLAMLHLQAPERVPAVKQATGDFDRMRTDRSLCGDSLSMMSGDDDITLDMMRDESILANGVVSVMSNLVPASMSKMLKAQASGELAAADAVAKTIEPLLKLVGCKVEAERTLPNGNTIKTTDAFRNPVPLKTMMAGLGMFPMTLRAPLGLMSRAAVERCREALIEVNRMDASVLAPIGEAYEVDVQARLGDDSIWATLAR